MKTTAKLLVYFVFMLSAISCSAPANIEYFQDVASIQGMSGQEKKFITLKPEDKINIIVHSADPLLASQFSMSGGGNKTLGATVSPETSAAGGGGGGQMVAYTVDEQGDIMFPLLGKIPVAGKTRTQVSEYISSRLRNRKLVSDAIVIVEYVNMGINILGEVNNPGHIDITKDHFTILDALAAAGDMTINGDREKVMVMRTVNGEEFTFTMNLCRKSDVYYSPAFYLQQNDVVYVAPNAKRKREANPNGNTFSTPGFWMSTASFMMALITFLTK